MHYPIPNGLLHSGLVHSGLLHSGLLLDAASQHGITFVYWAALYVHLFSAVAWMGGILFLTGVARPIFEYFGKETFEVQLRIKQRFLGFSWMLACSAGVTGVVILLWSTKFVFLSFDTMWLKLIHIKIVLFLLLIALNFALKKSYEEIAEARSEAIEGEDLTPRDVILWRIRMFEQIAVWTAIILLCIVSAMQI